MLEYYLWPSVPSCGICVCISQPPLLNVFGTAMQLQILQVQCTYGMPSHEHSKEFVPIAKAVLQVEVLMNALMTEMQGHPKEQQTFARVSGYCEQASAHCLF